MPTIDSQTTIRQRELLVDAIMFIRRRHNYGKQRRKEIRLELLKRYEVIYDN